MSLTVVSRVISDLQLDETCGVFTISTAQIDYVPFDLTGVLVVTM